MASHTEIEGLQLVGDPRHLGLFKSMSGLFPLLKLRHFRSFKPSKYHIRCLVSFGLCFLVLTESTLTNICESAYISDVDNGPPLNHRDRSTLYRRKRRPRSRALSLYKHFPERASNTAKSLLTLSPLATMFMFKVLVALAAAAISPLAYAVNSQTYTWKNVKIGGGGGFVPGIVFNPTEKVRTTRPNDGGIA